MANSTFQGKVRSQTGFSLVSVHATSGAETEKEIYAPTTGAMTAGSGFSGTGSVYSAQTSRVGNIITTEIYIKLNGLNSSATGDIIGKNPGVANCHFGQITAAVNGTIISGSMRCIVAPTTGDADIDVYYADVGTGAEDVAISGLAGQTAALAAGGAWTVGLEKTFTALPPADKFMYLTSGGAGADATYGAGQFLITLQGLAA